MDESWGRIVGGSWRGAPETNLDLSCPWLVRELSFKCGGDIAATAPLRNGQPAGDECRGRTAVEKPGEAAAG